MVGRITTKPGGKPEMGEVSALVPTKECFPHYYRSESLKPWHNILPWWPTHFSIKRNDTMLVWKRRSTVFGYPLTQNAHCNNETNTGSIQCWQASVVQRYNRPLPKVRTSKAEPGQGGGRQLPSGALNVQHIQEIIRLYQGKSTNHQGPMSVDDIASRFGVEASAVQNIVRFVSLPQDEGVEKKEEHWGSTWPCSYLWAFGLVPKLIDNCCLNVILIVLFRFSPALAIQDNEVSMEGLCSISTCCYDQWTLISVSGQLPKPRHKESILVFLAASFHFGSFRVVQQKTYVFALVETTMVVTLTTFR